VLGVHQTREARAAWPHGMDSGSGNGRRYPAQEFNVKGKTMDIKQEAKNVEQKIVTKTKGNRGLQVIFAIICLAILMAFFGGVFG